MPSKFFKPSILSYLCLLGAAFPASAQNTQPGIFDENGFLDAPQPDIVMQIRYGAQVQSPYFGSDDLEVGPDIGFRFDYVRFPGGFEYGSGQSVGFRRGWGLRGSIRYIGERSSEDYSELTGLDTIDRTFEFGLGIGYEQETYRAFADVRYGFFGHESFVAELGADLITTPAKDWTLTFGPRILVGSDKYMDTYFGITPDEAAASNYSEYDAGAGLAEVGLELTARYQLDELWGFEAIVAWSKFVGDAADSPIVYGGSDENLKIEIGVTRRIGIDF
ncbi:MipA/OmpV family protein [Falsihalocynthiibacter sp. SS001]|uniref:MipA/OmpV family protein n=1 Tax=Falsihalocynthiibacter sp. SS001 TaxID=3349698 RepID=UPI0036D29E0F